MTSSVLEYDLFPRGAVAADGRIDAGDMILSVSNRNHSTVNVMLCHPIYIYYHSCYQLMTHVIIWFNAVKGISDSCLITVNVFNPTM